MTTSQTFAGMQPSLPESELIKTEVVLENGRKLTVSMNVKACSKVDPDFHEVVFDVPCLNKKDMMPRSMQQLQKCECAVCKTACVTILKWRMMR